MKAKHIILTGFIFTALVTSLIAWGWLPEVVAACLFFFVSLALSFCMAVNTGRGKHIQELQTYQRALVKAGAAASLEDLLQQINFWVPRILPARFSFIWIEGRGVFPRGLGEENPGWLNIANRLGETEKADFIERNHTEFPDKLLPAGINSFIVLPLPTNANYKAALFIIEPDNGMAQFAARQEMLLNLCSRVHNVLLVERDNKQTEMEHLRLMGIALKAIESSAPGFSGHAMRVREMSLNWAWKK